MNTFSSGPEVLKFCHTLRDDGVSYGDYFTQLTYPTFLNLRRKTPVRNRTVCCWSAAAFSISGLHIDKMRRLYA
jgi:hypothetical protein